MRYRYTLALRNVLWISMAAAVLVIGGGWSFAQSESVSIVDTTSYTVTFNVTSDSAGSYTWGIKERDEALFVHSASFSLAGPDYTLEHTVIDLRPSTNYTLQVVPSGVGLGDEGGVTVDFETLVAPGSPPVAMDDRVTLAEDSGRDLIRVLNNDADSDHDRIRVVNYTQPSHGSVERWSDRTSSSYYHWLQYTPAYNYHGQDSFTYSISDGHHPPVTATVYITVTSVNDRPIIQSIPERGSNAEEMIEIQVHVSDDSPALTYAIQGTHENPLPLGATIDTHTGLFRWMPTQEQSGRHVITIKVSDGEYTSTQDLVFNIDSNRNPVISSIGNMHTGVGDQLMFTVNATDADGEHLRFLLDGSIPQGARIDPTTGIFAWTPTADQQGSHPFTIRVSDGQGGMDTKEIVVIVTATAEDALTLAEVEDIVAFPNIFLSFATLLVSIPTGHEVSFLLSDAPTGALIDSNTGIFTWKIPANQTGQHTFTVNVMAGSQSDSQEITVVVNELPDPISNLVVRHDNVTFVITSNSDESYTWLIKTRDGSIIRATGVFSSSDVNRVFKRTILDLIPNTDYYLQLTSDSRDDIRIDFRTDPPPGNSPVAVDDHITFAEDDNYYSPIQVLYNDVDPDGDSTRVVNYTQPSHGSVERASNSPSSSYYNRLSYTPERDYHGQDSFTYSISDGYHPPVTATVYIEVTPVNDQPIIKSIPEQSSNIDEMIEIQVRVSDDGPKLTYAIQGTRENPPPHGATIDADTGLFTWMPTQGQSGRHVITIEVSDGQYTSTQDLVFDIDSNRNPVIGSIGNMHTSVGNQLTFTVNATDADGVFLRFLLDGSIPQGARIDPATGVFTWTPVANQQGSHTFTIRVSDDQGNVATKEIAIIVTATAGDALVLAEIGNMVAFPEIVLSFTAYLTSIPTGHEVSFSLSDAPAGASIDRDTGIFTWRIPASQTGQYTFMINVTAGSHSDSQEITVAVNELPDPISDLVVEYNSVTFTITSDSDEPYTWLIKTSNDTVKATGVLSSSDTNRIFEQTVPDLVPNTDYYLQLTSDSGDDVRIDFRTDLAPGSPPVAVDDHVTLTEDSQRYSGSYIDVLDNDIDPDGNWLRMVSYEQPSHGRVGLPYNSYRTPHGALSYIPERDYHGQDSFTYSISDGYHPPVTATVYVTVTPANDRPTIQEIPTQNSNAGETIQIQVRASDVDDPQQTFHYGLQGIEGNFLPDGIKIDGRGLITWTPTEDQKGIHIIQLQVSDGIDTATRELTFNIGSQNSIIEPIGIMAAYVGERFTLNINTTGPDRPSFSIFNRPGGSSLSHNGQFTWTPSESQKGVHDFTIRATDRSGSSYTEEVTIIVYVVLRGNTLTFAEVHDRIGFVGLPLSFTVFPTSIPEGHVALFSLHDAPQGASINSKTGIFAWTPGADQVGQHTFTISAITGSHSHSEQITVMVDRLPAPITNIISTHDNAMFNITSDNDESYDWTIREKETQIVKFTGSFTLSDTNRVFERTISNLIPNNVYSLQLTSGSNDTVQADFRTDPLPGGPPVAADDVGTSSEDNPHTITVLNNDIDPDGDRIRVLYYSQPSHGSVERASNSPSSSYYNRLSYTPERNYHGQDSFTYTISDDIHAPVTGTVNITVTPVNDRPSVNPDVLGNDYGVGQPIEIQMRASDIDSPVESLTYDLRGSDGIPEGAAINASGVFTWTPTEDQIGYHEIEVIVSDGALDSSHLLVFDISETYIELDKKVYTWTNKVFITVVAPDHNRDIDLVDEIGTDKNNDPIRIATSDHELEDYKLVETGNNTGIFSGWVILTGFSNHDADGDGQTGDASGAISNAGAGPTDGLLPTDDEDRITVSFEFAEDETVLASALIRWNIAKAEWLEIAYPETENGTIQITDPDMNLNPEAVDSFEINVTSNSDPSGITLTVTETNKTTGIFEGTVEFAIGNSSGNRLQAVEGDTVTARYEDHTLPDPYNPSDDISIEATTVIGNVVTLDPIDDKSVNVQNTLSFRANASDVLGEQLTFNFTDLPAGATTDRSTGAFSWTPTIQDIGDHTFTITVYDEHQRSDSQNVTITVKQNSPPRADDITKQAVTGISLRIDLIAGQLIDDVDQPADTLDVQITQPEMGGATVDGLDIVYTPRRGASGQDNFTYTVTDDEGSATTGQITITVISTNGPPILGPLEDQAITAGQTLRYDMPVSDINDDISTLRFETVGAPAGVTIFGDRLIWTPAQTGVHTFVVIVTDPAGLDDLDTITVTVSEPSRHQTVHDIDVEATPGTMIPVRPDIGADITITSTAGAAKGTISEGFLQLGTIAYTANSGESGIDTVTYTASDGAGNITTGTVYFYINEQGNERPVLKTMPSMQTRDTATFKATASDNGGKQLTYVIRNAPDGATIDSTTGAFNWNTAGFDAGDYIFDVIVHDDAGGFDLQKMAVTVSDPSNDNPTAPVVHRSATTGQPILIAPDVRDPEGQPTGMIMAVGADRGTIREGFLEANIIAYVPEVNGTDIISYTTSDGMGGATTGTIYIHTGTSADPDLESIGVQRVNVSETLEFQASATDDDSADISYIMSGAPADATLDGDTGAFRWTPAASDAGDHTFTIAAYDGQGGFDTEPVAISVSAPNITNHDPDVADFDSAARQNNPRFIVPQMSDPNGDPTDIILATNATTGTILQDSLRFGIIAYVPEIDWAGTDTVTYVVSDGRGGTSTGTVHVHIKDPDNDEPVLQPIDNMRVNVSDTLAFNASASDNDDDPLTYAIRNAPDGATMAHNGTFGWTPAVSDIGDHTFDITVHDDAGGFATERITVTVTDPDSANQSPVAPDGGAATAGERTVVFLDITDPDGDDITVIAATGAIQGLVDSELLRDSIVAYTPFEGASGVETLTYTVSDGRGGIATGTINITINTP